MKDVKSTLNANGVEIRITSSNKVDYISLTDIAKYRSDDPNAVIQNWLRNRNTLEYLGLWEKMNNPNFKPLEFEGFKKEAGLNSFIVKNKLNFINPAISVSEDKKHEFNKTHFDLFSKFYHLKSDIDYCYKYELGKQISYSYSDKAINLIYSEIKKDPEHVIQNLKNNVKK